MPRTFWHNLKRMPFIHQRGRFLMKVHLLWFAGFLIALGTIVVLFRSYEDRHRFVLLKVPGGRYVGRFDVGYKTASRLPGHRWRYTCGQTDYEFLPLACRRSMRWYSWLLIKSRVSLRDYLTEMYCFR